MPGVKNKKRLVVLFILLSALLAVVLARVGYWSLYKSEWLQDLGESQWTQDVPVAAHRGTILDTNGNVLAQSASADTVILRPKQIDDPDGVADNLSRILEMDRQSVYEKATDTSKSEVWLKRQITRSQAEEIKALDYDGVLFTADVKRYYPNKALLTQVLGFTSVDGEGLSGIEKEYNKYLAGKQGRIIAETDKNGNELAYGNELYVEPVDGYNVVMTVDSVIQSFLEKSCTEAYENTQAESVQGIVMDPDTGQILAMANIMGYDLNDPPRDDQELLEELSRNRTTADVYEPGSTFKIITLAAALDSGAVTMDSTFDCAGSYVVDGEKIKCWSTTPHGHQNIFEAAQHSCNPCFMQMGLGMGLETFYDYIDAFGFGQKTGIDYPADQAGIVMDEKYVKNVDLARIAFGQSIAVTPLQLVSAVSAAVNGGYLYEPYLVERLEDAQGNIIQEYEPTMKRQVISAETSQNMREILQSVVDVGSGKNAKIEGYSVGGKTGTAQKYENGAIADGKVIASFIGFAPADDPEYVVMILVDEPKTSVTFGSVVAAPYVKEVLEQTLHYANVQPDATEGVFEYADVPNVLGIDAQDAAAVLESQGFSCTVMGEGEVTGQLPGAGENVIVGTTVVVYTETSPMPDNQSTAGEVKVPDVSGMTPKEAQTALAEAGFEIEVHSSGIAVRQQPAAEEYAEPGSKVKVYFALDLSNTTS